jgi:hypothetical protein
LGGGCGEGGFAAATCAIVGNQSFVANLRNATPGVAAFLVLGVAPAAFSCGPCQLIPLPLAALPAGFTSERGNAALSLPIPNAPGLLGATLLQQWITVAGTACPLGIQLSNALQVQLQ